MSNLSKTNAKSLIVIDSRVTDWKSLIGEVNQNATLLVLDSARDGLTQIAEAVANSSNIDAIHIISHGNTGSLLLGSTTLDSSNLSDYQTQLTTIGNALSTDGDILLYGCDVAQGDVGLQFINNLAQYTGADVAASNDLTGNAALSGDWVLEANTGTIEAQSGLSTVAIQNYQGLLLANTAPTFFIGDADGIVTTAVGSGNDFGRSVTVQADGKIVVAGGSNDDFALIRYNSDGSLDTSFDSDGIVTTAVGRGDSVTVQADGKILVAGVSYDLYMNGIFALTRYNSNGSLDTSFDSDGIVTTAVGSVHIYPYGISVTVQTDGKILAAGPSFNDSNADFALVRYNTDGSLDTSFGRQNTLGGTVNFIEGGTPVILDNNVSISDAELNASNYNGATLTLVRTSAANSEDVFSSPVFSNDFIIVDNTSIGKVTTNSAGTLVLTFSDLATQSLVNSALQQIAYSNSSNNPPASVQLDWTFNDGNTGGALSTTGSTTVNITAVNSPPTATHLSAAETYTEDTPLNLINIVVSDSDSANITATLTLSNLATGSLNTATSGDVVSTYSSGVWAASGAIADVNTLLADVTFTPTANFNSDFSISTSISDGVSTITDSKDFTGIAVNDAPTFNLGTGKVITPVGASSDIAKSVTIQTDGKILVAGHSYNGSNADFSLVRYNTDGSLDTSFDADGKVMTDIGSSSDFAYSVAVQADGKILATGISNVTDISNADFALIRYNTDGSLDTSFDNDGKVTTAIGSAYDYAGSVTTQADGKILVAGYSFIDNSPDFALIRYNTNGSLDTSFDTDGKVTTSFGTTGDTGYSTTIQADGKILVAGMIGNGSDSDFALLRYNTNGSLDTSFDSDGKVTTTVGTSYDYGKSVAVQTDGKIIVAGYSFNGSNYDFSLVRYNSNGSLDTSFDGDGKVTTAMGSSDDYGYSVTIQANGKILLAGYSFNGSNNDFALIRYNTDGSLDTSFDNDGKVTTDIGLGEDFGYSIATQADGKILVTGYSFNGISSTSDFVLIRYNADGLLDLSITHN